MRAASCALNGQVREAEATGTIGLAARMAGFLSPRVPTKLSTTCLSLSVYSYLGFTSASSISRGISSSSSVTRAGDRGHDIGRMGDKLSLEGVRPGHDLTFVAVRVAEADHPDPLELCMPSPTLSTALNADLPAARKFTTHFRQRV
jgi:hypothetical protein